MNKKKILLIVFISLIIIGTCMFIKYKKIENDNKENETLTQQELKDMEYVDNKINILVDSTKYKELSIENKMLQVEKLLGELKTEKYIKYYSYDDKNYIFSFEYKNGALGGVMIKDFDPMLN